MKYPRIIAKIGISIAMILTYNPGFGVSISLEYNIIPIPFTSPIPIAIIKYLIGIPNFWDAVVVWNRNITIDETNITIIAPNAMLGLADLFSNIGHMAKHIAIMKHKIALFMTFLF